MPRSCPPRTSTSARCPVALWESLGTRAAKRHIGWRSRPANSTSAGTRPRATFARPRCCSPSWQACTPCTTARTGFAGLPSAYMPGRYCSQKACRLGHDVGREPFFDTLRVTPRNRSAEKVMASAKERRVNLRRFEDGAIGISLDEVTTAGDIQTLLEIFAGGPPPFSLEELAGGVQAGFPAAFARTGK